MEYLILGIGAIYLVSTGICLLIMFMGVDRTYTSTKVIKGIINSFIPVLNTMILIRNLYK